MLIIPFRPHVVDIWLRPWYNLRIEISAGDFMDRDFFDKELDRLLTQAESLIPDEDMPDLPFISIAPDVRDWHTFEMQLWDVGEEIRQLICDGKKALTKDQVGRIISICLNEKGKRGRQSFVLLLGKKAYQMYAPALAPLLSSDDVNGHVIDTLYKMQAGQYADLIIPFTDHKITWIRNAAKKYVQKYR